LNHPTPALVTQRAVERLPRLALWLFSAAYLLPGVFGRDPWRSADIVAFGAMWNIAEGNASWLAPAVGNVALDAAPLPYGLGALFIGLFSPWLDPALAARIPFALLLGAVLLLTWYATYHLARTESAQPLPFAFGGEASATDYARAIADGALLALIATLGLLQLGHETTPELAQLFGVALFLYGLAASPFRTAQARLAVPLSLAALASSGAPAIAVALAAVGTVVCLRSRYPPVRRLAAWVAASGILAALLASALDAWAWRIGTYQSLRDAWSMLRLLIWFGWPAWPLALWTLWRWRGHLLDRHMSVPLSAALVALVASIAMGGSDRALMLGMPPLAVLAAFALPTFKRSLAAAIDWFSVFFFSAAALFIWVMYAAVQTGVPAKPAANVARLAPGFAPEFSALALALAVLGSGAWIWLVRWRTGRHRHALWKSLVLPASGVALCWLLSMTLLLPLLDYARSYRPLVQRIALHLPRDACIAAPGMPRSQLAALEYFGRWRVDGAKEAAASGCPFLLLLETRASPLATPDGWTRIATARRPTERDEATVLFRRAAVR